MAIGFYLLVALVIFWLSRLLLVARPDRTRYSTIALPLVIIGLILYVAVSDLVGVMIFTPDQATSYSLPEDYLALGMTGWVVMAIAVLGALSPVGAALLSGRRLRPHS